MDPSVFELNAEIEDRHWWFIARRTILRELLHAAVPPGTDAVVVDLGCGTGGNAGALAREYRVVGIDPSEQAIGLARARFPEVEFHVGSAEEARRILARANAVLLTDVMEHIEEDVGFFESVVEPLAAGAHILLTVPARPDLWSEHDVTHHHFRRYTPDRLRAVWRGRPVSVRLFSHYNARLLPLVALSRRMSRFVRLGRRELRVPPLPVNGALRRVFAGERERLRRALDDGAPGFSDGLSLIALLRRTAGPGSEADNGTRGAP